MKCICWGLSTQKANLQPPCSESYSLCDELDESLLEEEDNMELFTKSVSILVGSSEPHKNIYCKIISSNVKFIFNED